LCAIALSQNLLAYTKDAILDSLLDIITKNKDNDVIIYSDIRSYAAKFNIPGAVQLPRQNEQTSTLQELEQRVETALDVLIQNEGIDSWSLPTQYWCFSGAPHAEKMQTMFPRLLVKVVHGLVTTFVPK
jgi:hypothetical protein